MERVASRGIEAKNPTGICSMEFQEFYILRHQSTICVCMCVGVWFLILRLGLFGWELCMEWRWSVISVPSPLVNQFILIQEDLR